MVIAPAAAGVHSDVRTSDGARKEKATTGPYSLTVLSDALPIRTSGRLSARKARRKVYERIDSDARSARSR